MSWLWVDLSGERNIPIFRWNEEDPGSLSQEERIKLSKDLTAALLEKERYIKKGLN